MFDKISAITLALLLFLVLLGSANNLSVFVISLAVLILATLAVNIKRVGWSWSHLLLPVFFLLASGSGFAVITSSSARILFLIVASVLFWLIELQLGRESHFLQNVYLLTVFGIYLGIFALQFYFHLNIYLTAVFVFFWTYVLILLGFAGFSLPAKKYFYLVTALSVAELSWGVMLWPTHFFVNTVVIFCAFYLLWLFAFSAFFGRLSVQKIYWQLTLITIVLALTLSTAAWQPLVR